MNNKFKYFLLAIFVFSTITFCQFNTLEATILEQAQMDKARLEQELIRLEQEIVAKQKELEAQKGQSTTLNNEIKKLTIQINKSKLDIQAKNLVIKKLGGEITEKKKQIESLEDKISRERKSLAQLIRKERQIDDKTILSLLLTEDTISNVYSDVNNFALIK
jgi:septal ring factor EnvC (AmiA/AmiB activator)